MSIYKREILLKLLFAFFLFIRVLSTVEAQSTTVTQGTAPKATSPLPHLALQLLLPGQEITQKAADGLAVYFCNDFDNAIGYEDSYKLTNPDENIGILRNGKVLCIEGRKPVVVADTVPLKMWRLCQKQYTLKIDVASFSGRVEAYLQDAYLHSNIPLENDAETMVRFSINADAASAASDRFTIVFGTYATLPVELAGIKAYRKNKGTEVAWLGTNESNIDRYEIEQSANAQTFVFAGSVKAKNNAGISASYSWIDVNEMNGNKYYRIKTYERSGEIKYSAVVKVQGVNGSREISVSSNPGDRNSIQMFFKNADKGKYQLCLLNYSGQNFYTASISYQGGSASQTININKYLPTGIYQLVAVHENKREAFPLFIQ